MLEGDNGVVVQAKGPVCTSEPVSDRQVSVQCASKSINIIMFEIDFLMLMMRCGQPVVSSDPFLLEAGHPACRSEPSLPVKLWLSALPNQ